MLCCLPNSTMSYERRIANSYFLGLQVKGGCVWNKSRDIRHTHDRFIEACRNNLMTVRIMNDIAVITFVR